MATVRLPTSLDGVRNRVACAVHAGGQVDALCKMLGTRLEEDQVANALAVLDTDGNGTVQKNEFVHWYAQTTGHSAPKGGRRSSSAPSPGQGGRSARGRGKVPQCRPPPARRPPAPPTARVAVPLDARLAHEAP